MTPFDYANQIAELDPQATDYRQQVEKILRQFARDEFCRLRVLMEEAYRSFQLNSVGDAIDLCGEQAQIHGDNT